MIKIIRGVGLVIYIW